MKIYLDIDGTITYPKRGASIGTFKNWSICPGAEEFFEYVTTHHRAYWLSGWNRGYRLALVREQLLPCLPPSAQKVKCARFYVFKTEALNPAEPWLWFDDIDPFMERGTIPKVVGASPETIYKAFEDDRVFLEKHGLRDRLIILPGTKVNLRVALEHLRHLDGK